MISTQKCYLGAVLTILGILIWLASPTLADSSLSLQGILLEDFGSYQAGEVPNKGWSARGGEAKSSYRIASEKSGNLFLQAQDQGASVQYFREGGWDIKKTPLLSWRWRANEFPKDSNELKGPNDSAAAIYVVFPRRWFVPESIKYIWSEKVPQGTDIKRSSRFPMVIVRSGPASKSGEWQTETRNVYEDYHRLFGRRPSNPVAIGFLTDANDSKSSSKGDYDDIRVLPLNANPVLLDQQSNSVVPQP
jgi:hypothetical protein